MGKEILFVGSMLTPSGIGGGVHVLSFDGEKLQETGIFSPELSAGYLCVSPSGKFLYAVDEVRDHTDAAVPGGSVSAYAVDGKNGGLQYINSTPTKGVFPNYISIDQLGTHLLVTNYGGTIENYTLTAKKDIEGRVRLEKRYDDASVVSIELRSDGGLTDRLYLYPARGVPNRTYERLQSSAHPHSVNISADNKWIVITDRGCERIDMCIYQQLIGKMETVSSVTTQNGTGPRNSAFHPDRPYFFVVSELMPYVTAYQYNRVTGQITEVCRVDAAAKNKIPGQFPKTREEFYSCPHPADVRVSPDGNLLAVSVRGDNNISIYNIERETGKLSLLDRVACGGECPRTCCWNHSGRFLFVGNQISGNISVFECNGTGLQKTGCHINLTQPACIKMLPQ